MGGGVSVLSGSFPDQSSKRRRKKQVSAAHSQRKEGGLFLSASYCYRSSLATALLHILPAMLTMHPTLLIGPADWPADRMPREEFTRRIDALWQRDPQAERAIVYGTPHHHAEL